MSLVPLHSFTVIVRAPEGRSHDFSSAAMLLADAARECGIPCDIKTARRYVRQFALRMEYSTWSTLIQHKTRKSPDWRLFAG